MHQFVAYAFQSTLSLAELLERANKTGPWSWSMRDNDQHGDYLTTFMEPKTYFRVYEMAKNDYVLDIKFRSEAADAESSWQSAKKQLLDVLLPAVSAKSVRDHEPVDK